MGKLHYDGPVVLAILDGVGLAPARPDNAVAQARLPFLNHAVQNYLCLSLAASGEAVGVLPGQMGNSEVGHNALGSGQIIKQQVARIEDAFATGAIWQGEAWQRAMRQILDDTAGPQNNFRTLHFAGIFSDGGVHSDLRHLEAMIAEAYKCGVRRIRIHCVFDGRDVPPQSEPKYIHRIEQFMAQFQAIEALRAKDPEVQDQYLPDFVIVDAGDQPVGPVRQGDAFIYFDFRADRAIEIAQAFTYNDFPYFNRGLVWPELVDADGHTQGDPRPAGDVIRAGDLFFAGLTEYNSDTHVPQYRLIQPVEIHDTLNQFLGAHGKTQLAISETVKYGHVTYYFNGNSYEPAPGESAIEIPSDTLPFNTRPWMKSAEITDVALDMLDDFDFVRLNYPGGDMVGHFAELNSTVIALEAIDLELSRLATKVDALGGLLIIVADHGNAEELVDPATGKAKTSHTTNPVPCIFYDNTPNRTHYDAAHVAHPGIANLAATIADLMGLDGRPDTWQPSLIQITDAH